MPKVILCRVWKTVVFLLLLAARQTSSISLHISEPRLTKRIDVLIFHLIDNALWGEVDGSGLQGIFSCKSELVNTCELFSSDELGANDPQKKSLVYNLQKKLKNATSSRLTREKHQYETVSIAMYNIHTWKTYAHPPYAPNQDMFPTTYSLAESEESHHRFQKLFTTSFPHFDGNSTTHRDATVPRTYFRGWNLSELLPLRSHGRLINGSTFVASTCHAGDGNNKRMTRVRQLMTHFRVDSLGKCMHTKHIPEGIIIHPGNSEWERLQRKREAIANYKFYLAFENTNEPGYVTEKVFDALYAGIVPVYLGSKWDCQALMPSSHSVIYVADFDHDMMRVGKYLQYLSDNETAYEEYRDWRKGFTGIVHSRLVTESWPCRICNWAAEKQLSRHSLA